MAPTSPNTVEGGNPALNSALVIAQQVALLVPTVGTLANTAIALVQAFRSRGETDAATAEQARAAIEELRKAAQSISQTADEWLASHPPEAPNS